MPTWKTRLANDLCWRKSVRICPDGASAQMHHPNRILVVDENEINRDILVTRLEAHGYEALQAADGEEALIAAAEHRPDLILLDVMMPKLDGLEVCRRLKNDSAATFTPVILVTAKATTQDIVAGLDA